MNDKFLLYCSKWKRNSVWLSYFKDLCIFKNWPNIKTWLNFVNKIKISNKYSIFGNEKGKIMIYKI